ncbi:MAG: D-glycerate dehydrogenase [Elusimicrobia bacterium]|nr:D-glycerate dehydrogenase [Elusimicrobiota bacterium]
MAKPRVVVTQKIFPEIERLLNQHFETKFSNNTLAMPKPKLIRAAGQADGLLSFLTDQIDGAVLEKLPKIKIVANFAVGYNNIDVDNATRRNIAVTNTPGVLTQATADLTWALILATVRNIAAGDRYVRQGKFKGWQPDLLLGLDLPGKTLGIVGLGRIGAEVAKKAKAFGLNVIYCDQYPNQKIADEAGARLVTLEELLKESDIVSLHAPLTKETRHLMDTRRFGLMKPTAYLINTARGPLVDEKALVTALKKRRLAGAGLDVYENEPRLANGLAKLPNAVLVPHLGSAAYETRLKMARMAADNLIAFFSGQPPPNCVNPQVLRTNPSATAFQKT